MLELFSTLGDGMPTLVYDKNIFTSYSIALLFLLPSAVNGVFGCGFYNLNEVYCRIFGGLVGWIKGYFVLYGWKSISFG